MDILKAVTMEMCIRDRPKDSVVLLEQIRTIDKKRLRERIGRFSDEMMVNVDECLRISLGLIEL